MPHQSGYAVLIALLALPCPSQGCTLCSGMGGNAPPTVRQEAGQARIVLFGTMTRSVLKDGVNGETEFTIQTVLKSDPALGGRKGLTIARYLPIDPKSPPKYLIYCDVFNDKLDPYRGVPVKSAALIDYLKKSMELNPKEPDKYLAYFFNHLDARDEEIAQDAFMELVRASDHDLGQAAKQFSAPKLRQWLQDAQLPAHKLNLYAFMLGVCGTERDAVLLRGLLQQKNERVDSAYQGILCGYIQLRPREGWEFIQEILRDKNRSFSQRLAVTKVLSFQHGWKPQESRRELLGVMRIALAQADLADIAVEDLRRWQIWDLTENVLTLYGKKNYETPIVQRSIVRYALCSPTAEARSFVETVRGKDPATVKEVEESLRFEKPQP